MLITNLNGRRKGQTLYEFLSWIKQEKGRSGKSHCCKMADIYYMTDDELEGLWKEYTEKDTHDDTPQSGEQSR